MYLLSARDSDACIDRGHHNAGSWVEAAEYRVVVDSWADDDSQSHAGAFQLYANLTTATDIETEGLDRDVLGSALIDFSLSSTDRRQWTLDLALGSTLYQLLVSHGEGSGADDPRYADTFSNTEGSHMSSFGLMRTSYAYEGSNGNSLVLEGLEPGINHNVESRAIVVRGASYATQDFVDDYGLEYSACLAVDCRGLLRFTPARRDRGKCRRSGSLGGVCGLAPRRAVAVGQCATRQLGLGREVEGRIILHKRFLVPVAIEIVDAHAV